jgi:hypothetical protein
LTFVKRLSYPLSSDVDYSHLPDEEPVMNVIPEIESVARSYLEGELTLSELEEWLAPNLAILFQSSESDFVSRLAARIELAIAEMDTEGLGEDHVRDAIRDLLHPDSLVVVFATPVSNEPSSSNLVELERLAEPPEIRFDFPDSPFSSSAVTVVEPAEPSCTSA